MTVLPNRDFVTQLLESVREQTGEKGSIPTLLENLSRRREDKALQRLGVDVRGIRDKNLRKEIISEGLKSTEKEELIKLWSDLRSGERSTNADVISNLYREQDDLNEELSDDEKYPTQKDIYTSKEAEDDLSNARIASILGNDKLASVLTEEAKFKQKRLEKRETADITKLSKYEDEMDKRLLSQNRLRGSMESLEDAVNRQTGWDTLLGNISNVLNAVGIEGLQNATVAQINASVKDYFVESLKGLGVAGTRANQFLERMLSQAMVSRGKGRNANRIVLESMKAAQDAVNIELEEYEKAIEYYRQRGMPVPTNLASIVRKNSEKKVTEALTRRAKNVQKIIEEKYSDKDIFHGKGVHKGGSPITERAAKIFYNQSNGDIEKAMKMAKRKGYNV